MAMNKIVSPLICCVILSIYTLSSSGNLFSTPLFDPDPETKVITGTHLGTKNETSKPANMALVPAGKVSLGMDYDMIMDLCGGGNPERFTDYPPHSRAIQRP